MTILEDQLRAINAVNADPGVCTFRAAAKRQRPDLSNRSDTDVLGWLQSAEENAREFYDEYGQTPSSRAYEEYAEEIVDCAKRLIIAIQDAQGRHEEIG